MSRLSAVLAVALVTAIPLMLHGAGEGRQTEGIDMKGQHETMAALNAEWSKAKKAVKRENYANSEEKADRMLRIAPNIRKFEPHRNAKKREEFGKAYDEFVKELGGFRDATLAGDAAAVQRAVRAVDKTCNRCHATFTAGRSHHR